LTGITDADLVGAPTVDKVLADFYKFCDGCYLVGHNVQFDYRFVRYYGELSRYMFDQRQYDTMTLAQELLRGDVANYKLNTLADYYGVTFNHHRAFDDALATAKIFIQLIKKRKKLP
jgi:DNA polymerase III epsilon subunit-like protein